MRRREQAFLAELGQRAYYVPALDSRLDLATDPRLFGYTQPDEPDGHGIAPAQLGIAPGRVVFMTLTPQLHAIGLPRYRTTRSARASTGPTARRPTCSGSPLYPLSHLCGLTALAAVYDVQRDLVAFAGGRPTFQWLETGSLEGGCGAPVTPATVGAEAWLAIAGGARGLGWFTYGWPDGEAQSFYVDPTSQRRWAAQTARIQSLAPALLAPATPLAAGPTSRSSWAGAPTAGRRT